MPLFFYGYQGKKGDLLKSKDKCKKRDEGGAMKYLKVLTGLISLLLLISCSSKEMVEEREMKERLTGEYVSEGYFRRDEGYDWIKVTISIGEDEEFYIEVTSRDDIKKPTCTYEGRGELLGEDSLRSEFQGRGILFRVQGKTLVIEPEKTEDEGLLYYFCSGGASLRGSYMRVE